VAETGASVTALQASGEFGAPQPGASASVSFAIGATPFTRLATARAPRDARTGDNHGFDDRRPES